MTGICRSRPSTPRRPGIRWYSPLAKGGSCSPSTPRAASCSGRQRSACTTVTTTMISGPSTARSSCRRRTPSNQAKSAGWRQTWRPRTAWCMCPLMTCPKRSRVRPRGWARRTSPRARRDGRHRHRHREAAVDDATAQMPLGGATVSNDLVFTATLTGNHRALAQGWVDRLDSAASGRLQCDTGDCREHAARGAGCH